MSRENPISAFLAADGRDAAGRSFDTVLRFDDGQLESRHDFIQWLFPLPEPSRAVPGSPVLDAAAIAALRASDIARSRQEQAAARMLQFYRATHAWRRPFDHNHLRITRIIKSLRLLAGADRADAFKRDIVALAGDAPIDPRARQFWDAA